MQINGHVTQLVQALLHIDTSTGAIDFGFVNLFFYVKVTGNLFALFPPFFQFKPGSHIKGTVTVDKLWSDCVRS